MNKDEQIGNLAGGIDTSDERLLKGRFEVTVMFFLSFGANSQSILNVAGCLKCFQELL